MSDFQDDKAQHIIPFLLFRLSHHPSGRPFILALSAVQGAGKTSLTTTLLSILTSPPHNLSTISLSLDDFYLPHLNQVQLAKAHSDNPLLQHRGQPSTHDIPLLLSTFSSLRSNNPTKIPRYDKAAFSGQGDRLPESCWDRVNDDSSDPIRVVIFEGWCAGFRPLTPEKLGILHSIAVSQLKACPSTYTGRLAYVTLANIGDVNTALRSFNDVTDQFDALVHIDAADTAYVFKWRLEQETKLRREKGAGMTEKQVRHFVDGYYPSYELYTQALRRGVFTPPQDHTRDGSWKGKQLRLVVGEDRRVKEVIVI